MALYILSPRVGETRADRVDAVISNASSTIGVQLAAAAFATDGPWGGGSEVTMIATGGWPDFRFDLTIGPPGPGPNVLKVSVARPVNLASLGASLVALLNDTSIISAASFASPVLTVAGAADGLGDHSLLLEAYLIDYPRRPISGFVVSYTHRGAEGDALAVEIGSPAELPKVYLLGREA